MTGCSVKLCNNRSERGYLLKAFPKNPMQRKLWADKCRIDNYDPQKRYFICEVHFDEKQWENVNVGAKKKFRSSAVPTIFPEANTAFTSRLQMEHSYVNRNRLETTSTLQSLPCDPTTDALTACDTSSREGTLSDTSSVSKTRLLIEHSYVNWEETRLTNVCESLTHDSRTNIQSPSEPTKTMSDNKNHNLLKII